MEYRYRIVHDIWADELLKRKVADYNGMVVLVVVMSMMVMVMMSIWMNVVDIKAIRKWMHLTHQQLQFVHL